jgi:nitroreductase
MSNPRQAAHPIDPLFTNRWSPRAFNGEAVPEAQLLTLLEAARWAPSAYNFQPWRFIWARRGTPAWQPIFDALVPFNQSWAATAGALVVVASAKNASFPGKDAPSANPWHSFDAGAAWVSLAFQAQISGLAAHGTAGFDGDKLRAAIALPEDYAIETIAVIGKPGDKSVLPEGLQAREVPNDRTPLAQLASEGKFGA